jgi:hypothetical protein
MDPTGSVISLVLPVCGSQGFGSDGALALRRSVEAYIASLAEIGQPWEILLVPAASEAARNAVQDACAQVAVEDAGVHVGLSVDGWGAAVGTGLRMSQGELLCYTNYERTSGKVLDTMLSFAVRNPELVLRANRRTRDTGIHRLGSLLFNLECRAVLGIPAWDINGTPKIFPRAFSKLLELTRSDDLFDAEFSLVCEREGYPVVEIPVEADLLFGSPGPPDYRAALRMYRGVPALRRGGKV